MALKIYTKTGDCGKTALDGNKKVWKDAPQIEATGNLDELNASLGIIFAMKPLKNIGRILLRIQNMIFLASALASGEKYNMFSRKKLAAEIKWLEQTIDIYSKKLKPLKNFIFPTGTILSSHFHLARTICRRAERGFVNLYRKKKIPQEVLIYLNRLSDFLFILARYCNFIKKQKELIWKRKI